MLPSLKPVLNWANVCLPNILRIVRRTMIRFLTELLVGSNESHFHVSLIVMDKVTRQRPQTTTLEEKGAEAVSNRGPFAY